jgi:serine/threonine-protein kinase RIM15
MSDSGVTRRQPPSPLVFSPDNVLTSAPRQSNSGGGHHSSGSNTVSMPFVRRHVTRRLKAAKAECDKELQRVTNNITAFFEERLRDVDYEREAERDYRERERERDKDRDRDRDSLLSDSDPLRESFVLQASELRSALQTDESSSDGGYEAELESSLHSRQRAFSNANSPPKPPLLTHWSSSPGLLAASSAQSMSPSLRRQSTLPWEKSLNHSPSSSAISSSPAASTAPLSDAPSPRKQPNTGAPPSWGTPSMPSRRMSRTIHIPARPVHSGQSSRSTSRSRSPLPPSNQGGFFDSYSNAPLSSSVNRRSSRILVDDPIDPIMIALYDIISVATDVVDMSITQLTAQPKLCELLVQRVQNIGKAWDEHPDWHGRNWYVQVLLAVASLSRVVEWWEAEKQFWNFDDNDEEEDEPLTFVTKPADEPLSAPTTTNILPDTLGNSLKMAAEDENKLRLTRPSSQGRKSRDEIPKDLSSGSQQEEVPSQSKVVHNAESARVLATERLRLQAEMAQNQNIVVELSLDGDHFIWINYAWRVVIGSVLSLPLFILRLIFHSKNGPRRTLWD